MAASLALLSVAGEASAQERRVGLAGGARSLEDAVAATLVAWGLDVVALSDVTLGSEMPQAAEDARRVVSQHAVSAVVWVSANELGDGTALWIYDTKSDRVVARELPTPPPFDDATAAAVALSIRTLLRTTEAAPREQRFGAEELWSPRQLYVEAAAGVVVRPTDAGDVEPRLGLGAQYWPRGLNRKLGAAASLRVGTGLSIETRELVGRYRDIAASAGARGRLLPEGPLHVEVGVDGTAHFTRVDGRAVAADVAASASRINASAGASAAVGWAVTSGIEVQIRIGGSVALRTQRYLAGGAEVLELPRGEVETTVGVVVPVL